MEICLCVVLWDEMLNRLLDSTCRGASAAVRDEEERGSQSQREHGDRKTGQYTMLLPS